MSMSSIGERIRNIRGVESRKAFAEKFEIGTATLQRYEDNERTPDVEFLVKLQRYAEVTLDYLVNGEDFSLNIEEKNLLNNYRSANRELKNQTQLFLIGVNPLIDTTESVVNQSTSTRSGSYNNVKNQTVNNAPSTTNQTKIKIGRQRGDVVNGDKHINK
jgi:transcriptional regulator with XRE-family HTH domain